MAVTPSAWFYTGADPNSPLLDITGVRGPVEVLDSNIALRSSTGEIVYLIDNDPTLAGNASNVIPTQQAVKAYASIGATANPPVYITAGVINLQNDALAQVTEIDTDGTFATNSDTVLATEKATKTYVDTRAPITVYKPPVDRNLNALRLINSLNNEVTEISTDGTMADDSDISVPTQKAVRAYVASQAYTPLFTSVTNPLYIQTNSLKIYDAAVGQSGVVTTGNQVWNGEKTFIGRTFHVGGVTSSGDIRITNIPADLISYSDSVELRLWASQQDDYSGSTTGLVSIFPTSSATDPGAVRVVSALNRAVKLMRGQGGLAPPLQGLEVNSTRVDSFIPNRITSTDLPQLRVAYDGASYTDFSVDAGGDMTINAIGNDLNFHSSDRVHVLNIANCTGAGTGALQVEGGLYVAADEYVDDIFADEISGNDFLVTGASPFIRCPSTVDPLLMFSGNTPFTSASGAGIYLRPGMVSGHLDLYAGRNCNVQMYTGVNPALDLAMLIGPAVFNMGINLISRFFNTTQSTAYTNGSVILDGGLGVAKDIRCNGTIYAAAFSGPFTPAIPFVLQGATPQLQLKDTGGATSSFGTLATGETTITNTLNKEVQIMSNNPLHVYNTTAAVSGSTGALIVNGGIGCAGNLYSGNVVYGTRSQFTDAQDQITVANSVTGDLGRISEDTTGNLNLRTTTGKEVLVPSINPVHFYSAHATNALTVNGGITAASIQFNPVRGKYIDLLPSAIPHPTTPPVIRQFGSRVQWSCADGVDSILCCSMIFPEDIVPNTQLAFGLHWFAEEAPAGGAAVRIGAATQIMSGGGNVLTTPFTTVLNTVSVTANAVQVDTFLQAPTPANMTANAPSTVYVFFQRLGSDAADTYTGHIHIMGLSCRYTGSGYGATW